MGDENVWLRPATMEDMELLFQWANDPVVRKNSFSTEEISFEEHQRWYLDLLSRNDRRQYIYMCGQEPTGQIRLSISGETAEIGYSVCALKRGKGHGTKILKLICVEVEKNIPEVKRLIGKVKDENIASQKAFLDAGYCEEK